MKSSLAQEIARRNGCNLDPAVIFGEGYEFNDFSSFLKSYDAAGHVVKVAADIEQIAYDYLTRVALSGTIYVELMLSPPHETRMPIPYLDQARAVTAAAKRAHAETGIECRLIATAVRHLGPAAAIDAARMVTAIKSPIVVGFGLTGDERVYDVREFEEAFRIARSEGLRATAHAGEHLAAHTVIEAIEALDLDRVGHGIRVSECARSMDWVARRGTALEICISSNWGLGLVNIGEHPLTSLVDAGCKFVLGTDDPAFFKTSPDKEYRLAQALLPDGPSMREISVNAIEAAFCDDLTKKKLRLMLRSFD